MALFGKIKKQEMCGGITLAKYCLTYLFMLSFFYINKGNFSGLSEQGSLTLIPPFNKINIGEKHDCRYKIKYYRDRKEA